MTIKLIFGPMFSGKTSRLISEYKHLLTSNIKPSDILVINHSFDTRYSSKFLATHNEITDIECKMYASLSTINTEFINKHNYKAILINEGQFFNDIHSWVKNISKSKINIQIIISGLDADYKQEPFGDFLNIIPYCSYVEKLKSICSQCKKQKAEMTIRLTKDTSQVIIGNNDIYKPICSECY